LRQEIEHLVGRDAVSRANPFRRLDGPVAREHRQSTQEEPFLAREQAVAPVDSSAQGTLAGQYRPAAGGEQPEPVVQSRCDLLRGKYLHPSRCQLDR
jgi:hypothetical protein